MRVAHHGLRLGILALIGSVLGWTTGNKQNDAKVAAENPVVPNSEFRADGESLHEMIEEAKRSIFFPVPRSIGRFNSPYFHKDGRLDARLATALNLTPSEVAGMEKVLAGLRAEIEEAQAAAATYTYDEDGRISEIVVPAIIETREYEHRFRKGIEQVVGEGQAEFAKRAMGSYIASLFWVPYVTARYPVRYYPQSGNLWIGRSIVNRGPGDLAQRLEVSRAYQSDQFYWGNPDAILPPGIRHLFPDGRWRKETGG